ncbi:hypothetical protein FAM21834_01266 [Lentilactobacillus parabuchneri]|uniref:NAD(P)-binding domain-containing protein n=1 Tax=Lentilactobacillus parabuchneri TaxID=152331 RepID=A0A1X1FFF5_9LACO|nr:NAD(P)-binding oxidoreductase [Lentilactobacillus parabuchneri]ORN10236.1 hypothetical protein FAM21834_01266 [Lentilactobacillus parabuchneri]ORN29933.1 hypothetical protein FAM23169_01159 [Lentilactobacillus parabuchneri]TLQ29310.1 SDR family oxidoreductase [Lentilactobacillus parabuchneri]
MKKLLIIQQQSSVVPHLLARLKAEPQIEVQVYSGDLESVEDYRSALKNVNLIFTAVGPKDADLDFESLFDAIDDVQPPISDFVMLSYAGVDDELAAPVAYPGVDDVEEFIKQQRYTIKIVDESEIPYSIIRMGTLANRPMGKYQLFNEGSQMPAGTVSAEAVAKLAYEMLVHQEWLNHSVGIIDL